MTDLDALFTGFEERLQKAMASKKPMNSAPKEGGDATELQSGVNKSVEDRVAELEKSVGQLTTMTAAIHKAVIGEGEDEGALTKAAGLEHDISELTTAVEGLADMVGVLNKRTKTPVRKSIQGQDTDDVDDEPVTKAKGKTTGILKGADNAAFADFARRSYYEGGAHSMTLR